MSYQPIPDVQYSSTSLITGETASSGQYMPLKPLSGNYTKLAPESTGWNYTGTTSADGKAVVQKTTKNGRNMWGVEVAPGEFKKRSHYEITTGKKAPKAKACKNEKPKASITKKKGKSKKSAAKGNGPGKPKRGERAKAMRKLMATETAEQRKRDRKKTSKHVVRTAAKYRPLHNDFAKLDTAASGK